MMDGTQVSRGMRPHDDDELRRAPLLSLLRLHFPRRIRFKEKEFLDELVEKRYVIESNLDRRQLSKLERVELAMKIEEVEAERARKRREATQIHKGVPPSGCVHLNTTVGRARDMAAEKARLSPSTYHRAKVTLEKGSPELIQRDDYTPMEQAHAYRQAVDRYNAKRLTRGKANRKLNENVNKMMNRVKDCLILLNLPHDIQDRVHWKEISFTDARELTRVTRRKPEGPAGPSGRIVERGEGGRIKSGSKLLDERTGELGEANRMLSILPIQFLSLEDD